MKKRVLFVDDEPMLLSGLKRSLHGMREQWEMQFVDSAGAALEALEKGPYDAIISDMRMPLMDGADLLDQVKQKYPDMVRMILSGQSSRGAVFRSIAQAHQFLSKPCDPQELSNRLSQAFGMRDLLENQAVKTVVSGLKSLPSLPALYEEVMTALRAEDPSFAQVAKIVSKDVAMATKILQLANSAFMGSSGRVSSLVHALTLIGLDNVRSLVLSVNVFSQFDDNARLRTTLPCLWDHSVAVSRLAQQIAAAENCGKVMGEECFTAGLLHDVGKVVLMAELPREYMGLYTTKSPTSTEAEREKLGCTHAEVGAYLMSIWGLPFPLVHAVAYHHHVGEATETAFGPLTAVHAADAIVSEGDPSPLNHDAALDTEYLKRVGLGEKESMWRGFYKETLSQAAGAAR